MGWADMHQAITMAYQLSAKWNSQSAITISIQAIDHGLSAINQMEMFNRLLLCIQAIDHGLSAINQIINHTKNTHSPVQILNSPTIPIS